MFDPLQTEWIYPLLVSPFVGSFIGVVIARLPVGQSIVIGRSACPKCSHVLGARDLVPVLSWLASGGRCRYCTASVGGFYPAIEIAAVAVVIWAMTALSGWLLWLGITFGWALLALAIIDFRHQILPDELSLPLIPAGLAVAYAMDPVLLWDHVFGAVGGLAAFALVRHIYSRLRGREGLGFGDVKLLAGAGAWVSWEGLAGVVLIAALTALAAIVALSCTGRRFSPLDRVPFGTCICLALWVVWTYGPLRFE